MAPAPAPTPKPKPGDAGKIPLWAWGAATLVGLILGLTVLHKKPAGASDALTTAPEEGDAGYPQPGATGSGSTDDKGMGADLLAALGLLGDQLQGADGILRGYYSGSGGVTGAQNTIVGTEQNPGIGVGPVNSGSGSPTSPLGVEHAEAAGIGQQPQATPLGIEHFKAAYAAAETPAPMAAVPFSPGVKSPTGTIIHGGL